MIGLLKFCIRTIIRWLYLNNFDSNNLAKDNYNDTHSGYLAQDVFSFDKIIRILSFTYAWLQNCIENMEFGLVLMIIIAFVCYTYNIIWIIKVNSLKFLKHVERGFINPISHLTILNHRKIDY